MMRTRTVGEGLPKIDERRSKMITIVVQHNIGISVSEELLSYILIYAIKVGRLHRLCLKCSSVRNELLIGRNKK